MWINGGKKPENFVSIRVKLILVHEFNSHRERICIMYIYENYKNFYFNKFCKII